MGMPRESLSTDTARLETQFEGHSHASYLNEHLLNTHHVPNTMLGTAELKEKLLPCWQLAFSRTSGFLPLLRSLTQPPGRAGQPVRPREPRVALRKGKRTQTLYLGVAQGGSQPQSIPEEPRKIPNFSAPTPSVFLTQASSKK